ncbi:redoxin domain-containing protein [Sulfurimonas marina]|uniref:Redoxin domain-containing protein n=1 Tax=Sulfurimonas marina TaxID=2590551 RepID=A0A7M1ATG5_9BACT|nr:redoxin domain-containing protein [Sulfurimonas marina]QOP40686.1 redoxin domain-containing protein [Sulfurimonas marina]
MFKKKIFHYAKEFLFVILFMSIIANILSLYKSQELNQEPLQIKSFKLIDNSNYNIDSSKPFIIHFWATWCPTCKLEASNIELLSKYYNVVTIAVNSGSDYEIHSYLKERDLDFEVVNDTNSELSKIFKIQAYPTTFIYDKNQNLVFSEVGYTSTFGLFLRMWWVDFLK